MAVLNRLLRSTTLSLTLRRSLSSSSLNSGIGLGGAPPPPLSSLHFSLGGGGGGADTPNTKNRNVQWVFLGCPGVGKGTYAGRLSHLLRVPQISTGDLVREELSHIQLSLPRLSGRTTHQSFGQLKLLPRSGYLSLYIWHISGY
ncbi:probable adenylate kinase 6, chloroplastic [Camellia sinensis]|uniref:probable adenylate kinase 6, chloroplastic n=1 Tax=Camellia sinensis TaxID=4442 RepID=UPI0010361B7B|nr:probable adenylate kinase 6, chloroplastic [Camellia sinensis]